MFFLTLNEEILYILKLMYSTYVEILQKQKNVNQKSDKFKSNDIQLDLNEDYKYMSVSRMKIC